MWIGDRLRTENLPQGIKCQQKAQGGSEYLPNFVCTDSKRTEPINLIEYCTQIANFSGTFVTCIQADWHTVDWFEKDREEKEKMN